MMFSRISVSNKVRLPRKKFISLAIHSPLYQVAISLHNFLQKIKNTNGILGCLGGSFT